MARRNHNTTQAADGTMTIEFLQAAAECLKVMAHPHRLKMVEALLAGPAPVNRLADIAGLPPAQACEHLRLMKGHGLLGSSRHGRQVHYSIASPRLPALLECLRQNCPSHAPFDTPRSTKHRDTR